MRVRVGVVSKLSSFFDHRLECEALAIEERLFILMIPSVVLWPPE